MRRRRRSAPAADAAVVPVASLLADEARVAMLWALMDGRPMPAGDLARVAGVSASTASGHLARLVDAGWLLVEPRGRHRYLRLARPDVAALLEALAVVGGAPASAARPPDRRGALQLARSCYDHLAGQAGVALTAALVDQRLLRIAQRTVHVTTAGRERFAALGIDTDALAEEAEQRRRHFARLCLDWSERQEHLAGVLGSVVLALVLERGWFERMRDSRALRLTNSGRRALQREFGVRLQ
jgi:DNA-binding transcriptional ArsR family regulator